MPKKIKELRTSPRPSTAYRWFHKNAFHGIKHTGSVTTILGLRETVLHTKIKSIRTIVSGIKPLLIQTMAPRITTLNRSLRWEYTSTYHEASEQALYKLLSDHQETT